MKKTVRLYDAEKYDNRGTGLVLKEFLIGNMTDKEVAQKVKALKDEQKEKNRKYRYGGPKPINTRSDVQPFKDINIRLDKKTGNTIFILGSSKMGKSTLLMKLYEKYFNNEAAKKRNEKQYISTLFSINCQIPLYSSKKLIKICRFDKDCVNYIKIQKRMNYKTKNKFNFLEIFDDIVNVRYSNIVNELILTYRNSNISTIMSLQYPNLLAKSSRGSINNVIFFGFNTDESIKVVLDSFLKSYFTKMGYKTESEQISKYREMTKDHQFIYLHPASNKLIVGKCFLTL